VATLALYPCAVEARKRSTVPATARVAHQAASRRLRVPRRPLARSQPPVACPGWRTRRRGATCATSVGAAPDWAPWQVAHARAPTYLGPGSVSTAPLTGSTGPPARVRDLQGLKSNCRTFRAPWILSLWQTRQSPPGPEQPRQPRLACRASLGIHVLTARP
jgi:hypothetical protein